MQTAKNLIAAGHRATAESAAEALDRGGNAFDAAVAGVFAAMVAEPTLTSAGGGGYLLAVPHDQKPTLFDFFVNMPQSPSTGEIDFFPVDVDFGTATQQFYVGKAAAAVPGMIPGLMEIHSSLGRLQSEAVIEPAARLAKKGVKLNQAQKYLIKILDPILCHTDYGRSLYTRGGNLLEVGEKFFMPVFGDFLEALAKEGIRLWSEGDAGRAFVNWSQRGGGLIALDDLRRYRVVRRKPLTAEFAGKKILLNPPPAQSGLLIQVTLRLLDALHSKGSGRQIGVGEIIRALAVTNQIRRRLARIDELDEKVVPLVDHPSFSHYLNQYLDSDDWPESMEEEPAWGSTTHLSILDSQGNAASVTTTNGEGCGHFVPELGFMVNNMLGEKDLNPEGFHLYPPGVRLGSMVAPSVVLEAESPCLVTGSSGSNRIRSALVQILVNFFHRGLSLDEATQSGRLHVEGRRISFEPGFSMESLDDLGRFFELEFWEDQNLFFGGANSVSCTEAVADKRRSGYALIC